MKFAILKSNKKETTFETHSDAVKELERWFALDANDDNLLADEYGVLLKTADGKTFTQAQANEICEREGEFPATTYIFPKGFDHYSYDGTSYSIEEIAE